MSKLFLPISTLDLSITSVGLFIVLWGSVSYLAKERLFIGEAPIAIAVGILLGPYGLGSVFGWTQPGQPEHPGDSIDQFTLGLCRICLGIQLTLVGVQLPKETLKTMSKSLILLLIPVMTVMWLFTTACLYVVIPGLPILVSLIIASCTTATDPVLSNAIVKGAFADKYVSPSLRNLISAESGANDGFGYPFLFLAVHLLKSPTTSGALKTWVLDTILYQVIGSVVHGAILGYVGLKVLRYSSAHGLVDKESFLLYATGLGLFTVGTGGMLGVDDLLSSFIMGNILTWDDFYRKETEDDEIQNCVDLLLNVMIFLFVGVSIPFEAFNQPEYGITPTRLFFLSILILIFRRLPPMLLHYRIIPGVKDLREAAFMGYYGPIGIGTVFYSALVLEEFEKDDGIADHELIKTLIKPICYSLILASIVGHSLTIPLLNLFFVSSGVERIRHPETEDTDEEDEEGKEEYDQDSDDYQEDEEEEEERAERSENLGPQSAAGDRPTSYHRTNTMTSTNSGYSDNYRPSMRRRMSRRDSYQEADETGLSSSMDQHQSSWRISSGHKLGPHSIAVHRHSTVLRHGGSDDGEEVVLQGGWGGVRRDKSPEERRASVVGESTIKGKQPQSQEDQQPLLTVGQGSPSASGSGSRQSYGTLENVPSHLKNTVLKAKKAAKEKARAQGEHSDHIEEIGHDEHRAAERE